MLTIGELARRTGLSVSAIRFYEARGLVSAIRTSGNQRRFLRSDIRRLSFALIAQQVGVSLDEIRAALSELPENRTPTRADWARLSARWRRRLDERIALMERLRDQLTGCIGCGCLSLSRCKLVNPGDRIASRGAGAQILINPPEVNTTNGPSRSGEGP